MPPAPSQQIEFLRFDQGATEKHLRMAVPPFVSPDATFRQWRYIEHYAGELGCRSMLVESIYIDRDYMEDHSVFYSKSLYPYPNYCRRVHFFLQDEADIRRCIKAIIEVGIREGESAYRRDCRLFSEKAYLGFSVLKPLHGSPVGRTVLRCYPDFKDESGDKAVRDFGCTKVYSAHLLGVELTVRGLAFQQQDVGVSACATTAIWSSLQMARDQEDISPVTPAQITSLAGKHSLPFGRAMPSEGLSIDQMCQAIQAVGISPNVYKVVRPRDALGCIHSAVKSGMAPVLVLNNRDGNHAVTVVGMKLRVPHKQSLINDFADDLSGDLVALYIHDDRRGPYLKAELKEIGCDLWLTIPLRGDGPEKWQLTHILVPMHSKIRISLPNLRQVAVEVVNDATRAREAIEQKTSAETPNDPVVGFSSKIIRSHKYLESTFLDGAGASADVVAEFCSRIAVARYLGVVRLTSSYFDPIDVLIDTTSTQRNIHCLAVFVPETRTRLTCVVGEMLSCYYNSQFIY